MLKSKGLNQSYGAEPHAVGHRVQVPRGIVVSLIGRNGVGKTTLLGCLMGLLQTESGSIAFDGRDLAGARAEQRAPLGIGFVPQGRMIFPLLTVEENLRIGLPARAKRAPKTETHVVPDLVYELFPVLKSMRKRRGGDLSGGQQQQLAIGRALVLNPSLLILDEPTEGIQPSIVKEIGDVIQRLKRELAMTVLVVEQKLPFVRRVCDRFCIMDKGRVVGTGDMPELTDDLVRNFLSV